MSQTVSIPEKAKGLLVERAMMEVAELEEYSDVSQGRISEIQTAIDRVKNANSESVPEQELKIVVERAEIEYEELQDYSDVNSATLAEIKLAINTAKNTLY